MDRLLSAYLLIALMALALAGAIALRIHSSHERTYRRRIRKERAANPRFDNDAE